MFAKYENRVEDRKIPNITKYKNQRPPRYYGTSRQTGISQWALTGCFTQYAIRIAVVCNKRFWRPASRWRKLDAKAVCLRGELRYTTMGWCGEANTNIAGYTLLYAVSDDRSHIFFYRYRGMLFISTALNIFINCIYPVLWRSKIILLKKRKEKEMKASLLDILFFLFCCSLRIAANGIFSLFRMYSSYKDV